MKTIQQVCLALAVTHFVSPSVSAIAKPDINDLPPDCQKFINETLPTLGWNWGFLQQPIDPEQPEGTFTNVFYFYRGASDSLRSRTPVLFLNGGPFTTYMNFMNDINARLKEHDPKDQHVFVMMHQRGVGCSTPLQPGDLNNLDLKLLTNYGSEGIAHDAKALLHHLFPGQNKKWKVYANSYGATLITRLLHLFPETVSEVHLHAPTLYDTMADFYYWRTMEQNRVLDLFFAHYLQTESLDLRAALTNKLEREGHLYCLLDATPPICGRALLDVVLQDIGQGPGNSTTSYKLWDDIKDFLVNFIESTPEPENEKYKTFLAAVAKRFEFYRNPTSLMVQILWMRDIQFPNAGWDVACKQAHARLKAEGINVESLLVDSCRAVIAASAQIVPALGQSFSEFVKNNFSILNGAHKMNQGALLEALKKLSEQGNPIPFVLYTGDLDTLSQREALQPLITELERLDLAKHIQLSTGHRAWLYANQVWSELLKKESSCALL